MFQWLQNILKFRQDPMTSADSIHNTNLPIRDRVEALIRLKQQEITNGIASLDTETFKTDSWTRENNDGGGKSMVMQNGTTFEKGGVNISILQGKLPPQAVQRMKADHRNLKSNASDGSVNFFVRGLSIVIHPRNPHAPTVHANYRYFETRDPETDEPQAWWFGGGCDLTPSYLYEEDARHFHTTIKDALDKYDTELYPKYKKWCDEYFYIKHRNETRGVGGIFFDDFDTKPADEILHIVESCLNAFLPSYLPLISKRKDQPFTEEEKQWQQIRRGRYVEFNLVLDRGTQFGLNTPGSRIESILMSLPATASWVYDHHPEEGSKEEQLLKVLRNPVEWA